MIVARVRVKTLAFWSHPNLNIYQQFPWYFEWLCFLFNFTVGILAPTMAPQPAQPEHPQGGVSVADAALGIPGCPRSSRALEGMHWPLRQPRIGWVQRKL